MPSLTFRRRGRGPVASATGRVTWALSVLCNPHLSRPSPPLTGREGVREHRLALKKRTQIARRLRRAATEAEKEWLALRELPTEHRFRRQHPIGPYVVDFACPARKLAIELDGSQHAEEDAAGTPGDRASRLPRDPLLEQ